MTKPNSTPLPPFPPPYSIPLAAALLQECERYPDVIPSAQQIAHSFANHEQITHRSNATITTILRQHGWKTDAIQQYIDSHGDDPTHIVRTILDGLTKLLQALEPVPLMQHLRQTYHAAYARLPYHLRHASVRTANTVHLHHWVMMDHPVGPAGETVLAALHQLLNHWGAPTDFTTALGVYRHIPLQIGLQTTDRTEDTSGSNPLDLRILATHDQYEQVAQYVPLPPTPRGTLWITRILPAPPTWQAQTAYTAPLQLASPPDAPHQWDNWLHQQLGPLGPDVDRHAHMQLMRHGPNPEPNDLFWLRIMATADAEGRITAVPPQSNP